jgi:hypothetical protein
MDTAVCVDVESVVALADDHADAFIDCMSSARSRSEFRAALSGSFLSFLAEAARVISDG